MNSSAIEQWTLAYAHHIDLNIPKEIILQELRIRQSCIPRWTQYLIEISAWFLFYLGPFLILGSIKTFATLESQDQQRFLHQLQRTPRLLIKKIFLSVKTITLAACYGNARHCQKIGYHDSRI